MLFGGGPLIRFESLDQFIDALVKQKYNLFSGFKNTYNKSQNINYGPEDQMEASDMDYWSAFGPARHIYGKKIFNGQFPYKSSHLQDIMDFIVTSPHTTSKHSKNG